MPVSLYNLLSVTLEYIFLCPLASIFSDVQHLLYPLSKSIGKLTKTRQNLNSDDSDVLSVFV